MTAKKQSRPAPSKKPARGSAESPTSSPALATAMQPSARFFPLLLLLFVGSGCAALIYEIVWFQLLELTIGSSSISIAVLLATYMGGMFIGSLGLARVVSLDRHPLKVYALLEFGIGLCGLAVLWLLPYAGGLYTAIGGHGIGGLLLRGLISAICLLVPTILMGATLPAVSRWIENTPRGVSWLGFLYGGNTLGAVAGCLLAGFYLLRVHDMFFATYVAIAINVLIGGWALWLSRTTAVRGTAAGAGQVKRPPVAGDLAGAAHDRAVGAHRTQRRGRLDSATVAHAGRDGVHLLAHPGRDPARHRHRQLPRLADRRPIDDQPPKGARLVPSGTRGGHRVVGVPVDGGPALPIQ